MPEPPIDAAGVKLLALDVVPGGIDARRDRAKPSPALAPAQAFVSPSEKLKLQKIRLGQFLFIRERSGVAVQLKMVHETRRARGVGVEIGAREPPRLAVRLLVEIEVHDPASQSVRLDHELGAAGINLILAVELAETLRLAVMEIAGVTE